MGPSTVGQRSGRGSLLPKLPKRCVSRCRGAAIEASKKEVTLLDYGAGNVR